VAGLRKARLIDLILAAIQNRGVDVAPIGFVGDGNDLPWACEVRFRGQTSRRFLVYCWTISHGGRARPLNEYRIQVKLRSSRRLRFGDGTSLLLGYYDERHDQVGRVIGNVVPEEMKVFVAWDPLQHLRLGESSSCQVKFETMYEAYIQGAASSTRQIVDGSMERIIAFRPEKAADYFRAAAGGHNQVTLNSLREASASPD
jgi:hypothetical protein